MKLIRVPTARAIWLFDVSDLNPTGKDITEEFVEWIRDEYHFSVAPDIKNLPTLLSPQNTQGLVFEHGTFQIREEFFIEVKLTMFRDGFVVDTSSSTSESDKFLGDLLKNASQEFGLTYDESTVRKHLYLSELIVRSEMSLDLLNPVLKDFGARFGKAINDPSAPTFECASLRFWSDPEHPATNKAFVLEREAGKHWSEHRYWSQAPTQTDPHFDLLQRFEQLLLS